MIISQSVFATLCMLHHTDLELYMAALAAFDMSGFIRCGSYSRDLISYTNGSRVLNNISVIRLIRKGSMARHTYAFLPDIILPHSSYSIRFIISVIYLYQYRNCSAIEFCDKLLLSRSTLHEWKNTFDEHTIDAWVKILKDADNNLCDKESAKASVPDFSTSFIKVLCNRFITITHLQPPSHDSVQHAPPDI